MSDSSEFTFPKANGVNEKLTEQVAPGAINPHELYFTAL